MTQRDHSEHPQTTDTPSERARAALRSAGMNETPSAALERADALFVLTPGTLLYQDGAGTRRVTLRDLTRIHSDQEGTLRVETPAGTALTASLLGFDPAQVQNFFAQVRTVTHQAKQTQATPLPAAPGQPGKTFAPPAPAPAMPAQPAQAQAAQAQSALAQPNPAQSNPARPNPAQSAPMPSTPAPTPAPPRPAPVMPAPSVSAPAVPAPNPSLPPRPAANPVVISSSGFSPGTSRPSPATSANPVQAAPAPAQRPPEPVSPHPLASPPAAPLVSGPVVAGPAVAASSLAALARHADAVHALLGRLRLLGAVLFVAALALAYFQFAEGARLDGLWTLLAGGVGTIALLALADLGRLLVALSRAVSGGGGVMDVD